MKKILFVLACCALVVSGCDSQSPAARHVSDLNVQLLFDPDRTEFPAQLDYWETSSDDAGYDIYSASFGFVMQVTTFDGMENAPVAGIRVDCYIEHCDPLDAGYDIWEKFASNGQKYGFVNAYPPQTANWDFDKGHASAKTSPGGVVAFYIGLGKSEPPGSDIPWGWEWLRGCGTMISTGVKLKFVIRKWNSPLEQECHVYFIRPQCADFWEPEDIGVYYVSYSSLNPAPDIWGMSMMEGPIESTITMLPVIDCPARLENAHSFSLLDELSFQKGGSMGVLADYNLLAENWLRLAPDDNGYWVWNDFNSLNVLLSPDPCIPNDANDIFSYCTPYSFFCVVEFDEWYETCCHTVILKSKTSEGELVSWMPVHMYLNDLAWPYHLYKTEYVVPIDTSAGEGNYRDIWGYSGVMIEVVEDGYLEVKVDDFYGDFNFDGIVDGTDFRLFAKRWYWNMFEYQYMHYDLMYDATQDGWTTEDDLAIFVGNWLKERPE